MDARSRSLPVISARPSTRKMMWDAWASATSACRRICAGIYSWSWTTIPPVSISSKRRPSCSASPWMRSRVMPGSSPTMARRCPVIRLKRVDFPTLGRPTITTVGMAWDMNPHDSRHAAPARAERVLQFGLKHYPIFLDLKDRPVLVVGAGRVALRKTRGLLEAGARVTVVAPEWEEEFESLTLRLIRRRFRASDLAGAMLVFAA